MTSIGAKSALRTLSLNNRLAPASGASRGSAPVPLPRPFTRYRAPFACTKLVSEGRSGRRLAQHGGILMFRLDADRPVEFCDGLRRRDFLHAGSLPLLGLGLTQMFGLKAQGAVDKQARRRTASC